MNRATGTGRAGLPLWLLVMGCFLLSALALTLYDEHVRRAGEQGILNFHSHPGPVIALGGAFWLSQVWAAGVLVLLAKVWWRHGSVRPLDVILLLLVGAGVTALWMI